MGAQRDLPQLDLPLQGARADGWLCELDGVREQALYVGLSRPSVFLSIFGSQKALQRLTT